MDTTNDRPAAEAAPAVAGDDSGVPAPAPGASTARRVLLAPPVLLLVELLIVGFVWIAVQILAGTVQHTLHVPLLLAPVAVFCAVAIVAAWKLCMRWIERRPDRAFAYDGAAGELAVGLAIGTGLMTLVALVVWALGGLTFDGLGRLTDFWPMVTVAAFSGFGEEALFRGVLLRQIERMTGTWGALAITALIFGLLHLANPNATLFAGLAIALEAGLLLGAAYLYTRRLWLAVGIHASWNFVQGWVFMVPVSGSKVPNGLFATTRHGPELLTGGAFGLEASAAALVVATLAGGLMLVLARRRGRFVSREWPARRAAA